MSKDADATIGRLVAEASRDLGALMQAEVQLAKSELRFSVKAGGIGAAMFVVAAFFALLMAVLTAIGVAYVLAIWVGPVWGFFILAGACLLLAALSVVIGIVLIKKVRPPTATIATAKQLPATFKGND